MSLNHFNDLRDRSCNMWIEAEAAIISLNEQAQRYETHALWLGRLTVASAMLVAASSIVLLLFAGIDESTLTAVFGAITGGLAVVNQSYDPAKKEKDIIELRSVIFTIQRDIKNSLMKLKSKPKITVADDFSLEQASDRLDSKLMSISKDASCHLAAAKSNLEGNKYDVLQYAPVNTEGADLIVDVQMDEGESVPGVKPFGRGSG